MKKIKVLYLTHTDNNSIGQGFAQYHNAPDYFEKRIITQQNCNHLSDNYFYEYNSKKFKIVQFLKHYESKLRCVIRFKEWFRVNYDVFSKYAFWGNDYIYNSASSILSKLGNFKPDVICIFWIARFLNPKVIMDLYKSTKAHFVFVFVDEAHMTAGCHFPVDCEGFMNACENCPGVVYGKKMIANQFIEKKLMYDTIPHTIVATPYDCDLAVNKSSLLKGVESIKMIFNPSIPRICKKECRKELEIKDDEFAVVMAANGITQIRKGINYAITALEKFTKDKENIALILLDKNVDISYFKNINARLITPGFVPLDTLLRIFKASDCFISPSIGDSGPTTVNYAIKLGTPVISFNVGIACTLVDNGKNGYVVPLYNTDAMADALRKIWELTDSDRDKIPQFCEEVFDRYKDQESWEKVIYNKFINNEL